jgi:hypothetical protein
MDNNLPQQYSTEVEKIRTETSVVVDKALEIAKIETVEHEARATEFLSQIKRRAKLVKDKRDEYVKPLKSAVKNMENDFKTILLPLEQAESIVKQGVIAFRNSEEIKAKELARKEAELAAKKAMQEASNEGTAESVKEAQQAVATAITAQREAPKSVQASSGSMSFRTETRYEVMDYSLLPPAVISKVFDLAIQKGIVDQVVRFIHKSGMTEIPGVKIWEEKVPVIRA